MTEMVVVDELHKVYSRGSEVIDVLAGLQLRIAKGEFLALMGPSGSGKSTLLNLIGGLDRPTRGVLRVDGQDISSLSDGQLASWRADNVGFVFQMYNLMPVLTASRNVELPLLLTRLSGRERKKHVAAALDVVGLSDRAQHYPRQLSGGQEQRVGIARAIVTDPQLLLCDEPTGDLDRKSGDEILDLLDALNREQGKTVIMVTHDPLAAARANRVLHLDKGRLVEDPDVKYLHLIWAGVRRKPIRTGLTICSIAVAFVLFGVLSAVSQAFKMGVDVAGADRLMLTHKVSLIQLLPESYLARIAQVDGVRQVTHATWFGGIYQDPKNMFGQFPVVPDDYMAIFPELLLPSDQMEAWRRTKTGAIAGRQTAEKFGWKIGDRVPIQGDIWRRKDGAKTWEFDLVGIYEGAEKGVDDTQFLFRYDYFDEARGPESARGLVGWYNIAVDDPGRSAEIASAIDSLFSNSSYETKTSTEKAFMQDFANQLGDIGSIITVVLSAVFFTILIVAANTMAQSVRERTAEIAVLKTLGFGAGLVLAIVLLESMLLTGIGGFAGLALAKLWVDVGGDPTGGALPIFFFADKDLAIGAILVLALGFAAGLIPAIQAMRLPIVDALRRA